MIETPRLLDLSEVADYFGVDRATVRRWCREHKIAALRTPGGEWRIPPTALAQVAANNRKTAA